MKILRAQKQIKRISGEIKELEKRASACLNTLKENEFKEDLNPILEEIAIKDKNWVDLKSRVLLTNCTHNMTPLILSLGKLKIRMDRVKEMKPREGVEVSDSYRLDTSKNEYHSQLTLKQYQDIVKECQDQINNIVDELDEFNAKTDLEELPIATGK